ncbi:MAG: VWA domain-containing protein [Chitinophagaceae bacterium]|nr:VWA domain-containing protein [Chitinophagaceae bacterium]
MSFQHIEYLFALCLLPFMVVLFFFYIKWKKTRIKKIGDLALVQLLISNYSQHKFSIKFILLMLAFIVTVLALANPRIPMGSSNIRRNGIDVMIALDVSKSMLAQDIKPNRLERAKQLIAKLIDKLPDDRIGIVVFAGRAYLQMPLTSDHAAAKMYLSTASPDIVPTQGTVIGDALKMCYAGFNTKEKKYKSIVLISDGEDHDESAEKLAQSLADEGVMINSIGIGSPEGANIIDATTGDLKKDAGGKPVITRLNETGLRNIAAKTGGIYQLFTSTDEVAAAIDGQLRTMGQRSITETSLVNYRNFFPWLLGAALLLLVAEFFISEKKSAAVVSSIKVKPGKTQLPAIAGLLLCLLTPSLLFAQNAETNIELVKKGNEAYRNGQYQTAANNYKKATTKDPFDTTAQYNFGNALYKTKKTEDALQAYDAAIAGSRSATGKAGAWYNKGVVLQNNKKLAECIDAYKNALKLNPADEDARLNLQKALKEKKQQEQKDKQDQQKNKNKKQDEKPKEEQPKPKPSKMTKKEAEEKLKVLLQQEKNLQDKLRKVDANAPNKPEKDW